MFYIIKTTKTIGDRTFRLRGKTRTAEELLQRLC